MTINSSIHIDTKNKNQSSDLFIWEETRDGARPNILYDSHKTNNDMEYLKKVGISIIETDNVTKVELL